MKKFLTVLLIFFSLNIWANDGDLDKAYNYLNTRGEVYFKIHINELNKDVQLLSKILSIDKVESNVVFAYANNKEFETFLEKTSFDFETLTPPSMLRKVKMKDNVDIKEVNDWDFYPTYEGYENIMEQFASDYPNLCELETMTTLPSGRKLLVLHINNNLSAEQNEPEFLYTSTMHGDEVTGYVLMLHYIDYLLSNYGTNPRVTDLVNNIDIWINPLANPDGTYAGGNNTVYGATRYNGNDVDLNRNYPDPDDGSHPDGNSYQPETQAFMQLADEHSFVMSANFHGGAEVVNYPWDTWARLTADNDWWVYVSREYADTAHVYNSNYMNDMNNGITNGYAWYTISGGRQDYMNYYKHCREVTIELSESKTPPASQLPDFWNYNYRSFLNYMEQSTFGLRGIITDNTYKTPIEAKVYIEGHDMDNSEVYSSLPVGDYHRMLKAGTYNVTYSAYGHYPQTVTVTIQDRVATVKDIELQEIEGVMADFHADITSLTPGESVNFTDNSYGDVTSWQWSFPGGEPSSSNLENPQNIVYNAVGSYPVTLIVSDNEGNSDTITKEDYINVANIYLMQNGTVELMEGIFYDSGGEDDNYENDEDYTMTFKPAEIGGKIQVEFEQFDVEENSTCDWDYLEIYDGTAELGTLVGKYCGTTNPPVTTATNPEGILTFVFHSNSSINKAGWKALITVMGTGAGIEENKYNNVVVYPNPSNNFVFVRTQTNIKNISLYNLTGQLFGKYKSDNKECKVDLSSLNKGFYILKVETEKGEFYEKVIKN